MESQAEQGFVKNPPGDLPPPYAPGGNPDLGKPNPYAAPYPAQSNPPTQPMAPVNNYNVAGGYATGPTAYPYGYNTPYGTSNNTTTTTNVIVNQPGRVVTPIVPVRDYTVASILSTIFCCLCFGIMGIISSNRSKAALASGDYALAKLESLKARNYVIAAVVFGVVIIIISTSIRVTVLSTTYNDNNQS